jgi:hypothetical protein
LHSRRRKHLFDFASALWTLLQHGVGKSLDFLETVAAFLAKVLVIGHGLEREIFSDSRVPARARQFTEPLA